MAHNVPIEATSSIIPSVTIELRRGVLTRWVIALCAWAAIIFGAVAALLLAGDVLLARGRHVAEWWWQRPEGLVLGSVALLIVLMAVLADHDNRADADKPVYDIR